MSPAAVALFRAHRAGDIRFSRNWMRQVPDSHKAETVNSAAEANSLYRTWHDYNTREYFVLSTKVRPR